jgi:TatA/E family protein of Tat protein translocase
MGPLGWQETVFIFVLALLLFGPKKLPELGRTIGKAITEFRRASNELKATFDREMSNLERENESLKEITSSYQNDLYNYSYNYDSSYDYESGSYGSDSYDSTAANAATVSASATEGAESTTGTTPDSDAQSFAYAPEGPGPAEQPVATVGADQASADATEAAGEKAASESHVVTR